MRIVLDTNVVLSALLWRGTPYHLLSLVAERPGLRLYSTIALLDELADVLDRPTVAKRLESIGRGRSEVLADYLEAVDLVEPLSLPRIVPEDADDDQVIAAAVAAHAHMIVSGDRHVLALRAFEAIEIVTAAAAIERLLAS